MGIVTDSSHEIPKNVYEIHKLFRGEGELEDLYEKNKGKYKILKETLIDDIEIFIKPMRERRQALEKDLPNVLKILKEGGEKAKKVADIKMREVKEKIGVEV